MTNIGKSYGLLQEMSQKPEAEKENRVGEGKDATVAMRILDQSMQMKRGQGQRVCDRRWVGLENSKRSIRRSMDWDQHETNMNMDWGNTTY